MSLDHSQLEKYAKDRSIEAQTRGESAFFADCDIIEFMLDNCEIAIDPRNRFFVDVPCRDIQNPTVTELRVAKYRREFEKTELYEGQAVRAYSGDQDFGHTSPVWESVIALGIFGLRQRVAEYAEKYRNDSDKQPFYRGVLGVYDAALRFMLRAADEAEKVGKKEMAQGLRALTERAPQTLFEAMQTSIVYYMLQHAFEGTILRTLGRVDSLFYPYFLGENRSDAEQTVLDYICEIDRLRANSNIPFALGGTDVNGRDLINELSYVFVQKYREARTVNTKFHLLCSKNTPTDIIEQCFEAIRAGDNSIVFMSDERVIESLVKIGANVGDASNYHVVGCYECGANEETTCSCNARVNIPKALELTLNGGVDMLTGKKIGLDYGVEFDTFEKLCAAFYGQLEFLCDSAMNVTDYFEEHYAELHSAPFMSSTYTAALDVGRDVYAGGARYCNSSVNAIGLATAADSLASIRKLVYEDGKMTLSELCDVLKNDWRGYEAVRLTVKNKYPKFGIGDSRVDQLASKIVDVMAKKVGGRPNKKGGIYRLGLFSINWRWELGEYCAASADGRHAHETLSQNTSATFGADREGATAHLWSISTLDTSQTPNGAIVDIDLHSSAVRGKNGLLALTSTLKTYFERGGFAVHYNVMNTDVLKEAVTDPDKYPNLQVRLCGWNVLFSSLSNKEKAEFIARSEKEY